jgi:hypothetical protein
MYEYFRTVFDTSRASDLPGLPRNKRGRKDQCRKGRGGQGERQTWWATEEESAGTG